MNAVKLLLVEDDPRDCKLVRRALSSSRLQGSLHHVPDGMSALAYLRREGSYAQAVLPDLVLLDLKMPGMSGLEVLQIIKSDEELASIPVVVLTTSDADRDVTTAYRYGANCYIRKPLEVEEFREVVSSLESFWFTIVSLPSC